MEVSGKVLREVEFRDRLRGYDTDEVDEFLEKVAVGVDALRSRLDELEARLAAQPAPSEAAPAPAPAPAPAMDDDAIRRTLVLAQRTADLAVGEAREEAARLLEEARAESESVVGRAEDAARRLRAEAEQEVQARVDRLNEERDRLEREVHTLARVVEDERSRLTESLNSALRYVRETLTVGDEASRAAEAPGDGPRHLPSGDAGTADAARQETGGWTATTDAAPAERSRDDGPPSATAEAGRHVQPELPDVEAEVHEDAASAAWSPRNEPGRGHVGQPRPIGPAGEPSGDDAEEALWERWAAGRDLGVVPGPSDFGHRSSGGGAERDRGWSA